MNGPLIWEQRMMNLKWASLAGLLLSVLPTYGAERDVQVHDDASLRAALTEAGPGTRIRIAPGNYRPGVTVRHLHGTKNKPIVIEGADSKKPPAFRGGTTGWHLSDCSHLVLRNLSLSGQSGNGLNIDDGGSYDTPARHILIEDLSVADIGPTGNHDGIKLSGVDDFIVRRCRIEGWGGQAIDMVGCHRGVIEKCDFTGKSGYSQNAGPQTKGGSSAIVIRACHFRGAGGRAVNLGGSTGKAYFRPLGAKYEAKQITVEGCTFLGGQAPIAFVGVEGAVVRYNTIYHPEKWVLRILQETRNPDFVVCGNNRFERNLIVFRRSDVNVFVNIGPGTAPETFQFADNYWYCEDRPTASRPQLPVAEAGGVYGRDPKLKEVPTTGDAARTDSVAAGYGAWAWKPGSPSR
jgi:hypothetical protein